MSTSLSSSLRAICPLLPVPPPVCSCCMRFRCLGDRFSRLSSDWKSSSVEDSLTCVLFSSFETITTSSVLFLGVKTRERWRWDEPNDLVEEAEDEEPEATASELSMMTGGWLVTTVTWLTLVARLLDGSASTVSLLMVIVVDDVLAFGVDVIRISSSGGNIGGGGTGWYG